MRPSLCFRCACLCLSDLVVIFWPGFGVAGCAVRLGLVGQCWAGTRHEHVLLPAALAGLAGDPFCLLVPCVCCVLGLSEQVLSGLTGKLLV